MTTPDGDRSTFVDTAYRILSDRRRRLLLWHLESRGDEVAVVELADRLAERESVEAERETVAIDLYHRSLPMLADAEAVEYDTEEGTVALTARGRTVAAVGRTVTERLASA